MRGKTGFTLVELLIVVAIIGILAAVVMPNVISMMGSGAKRAFETDEDTMQGAAAAFYLDVHSGWVDENGDDPGYVYEYSCDDFSDNAWANDTRQAEHRHPTAIARAALHVLVLNENEDAAESITGNPRIDLDDSGTSPAGDCDIEAHAIWVGLLANAPGDHNGDGRDRDGVAPLRAEGGPYLQEIPRSAMATDSFNGAPEPGGRYCWVVGRNGGVFGAYKAPWDSLWYAGFSDDYP